MVSSRRITDYPNLMHPERMHDISANNAKHLREFIDMRRLNGIGLYTINVDVQRVVKWMRIINKDDALNWSSADVTSAYLSRLDEVSNGVASGVTLDVDLRGLKMFWRFLNPDKPPIDIRKKKTRVHLQADKIVSVAQVLDMKRAAEAAGEIRDAALIMTVLGTGCRISELTDARVSDVEIGPQFAKIRVEGKTGYRVIPFVTGLPELQSWINCHPLKHKADAPLFVTKNTRGHGLRQLNKKTANTIFHKYAKIAGVPEDVKSNPHAVRHLAASEDDRYLTHQEMCLKFGWTPESDMPKNYTHSNFDGLKRTIISAAGIETPEQAESVDTIHQCPRCKSINTADAKYCCQCSLPLNKIFEVDLQKTKHILSELASR